jgi:hypothetical protein
MKRKRYSNVSQMGGTLMRAIQGGLGHAKRKKLCDLRSNLEIPSVPTEFASAETTISYTTVAGWAQPLP